MKWIKYDELEPGQFLPGQLFYIAWSTGAHVAANFDRTYTPDMFKALIGAIPASSVPSDELCLLLRRVEKRAYEVDDRLHFLRASGDAVFCLATVSLGAGTIICLVSKTHP